jgi:hypothetical protein
MPHTHTPTITITNYNHHPVYFGFEVSKAESERPRVQKKNFKTN